MSTSSLVKAVASLEHLLTASAEDIRCGQWDRHEEYRRKYNNAVKLTLGMDGFEEFAAIPPVNKRFAGTTDRASLNEQNKLRDVVAHAELLLAAISLTV